MLVAIILGLGLGIGLGIRYAGSSNGKKLHSIKIKAFLPLADKKFDPDFS